VSILTWSIGAKGINVKLLIKDLEQNIIAGKYYYISFCLNMKSNFSNKN
jgi:hypothetical protein